jgi:hypothetical protein
MEEHVFDVAGLVEVLEALGKSFDLIFCKNEPILSRMVWDAFVFMELQEGRGVFEIAALALGAVGLDFAELVQGFLELAREPVAVQAERGKGAVGVDDVEVDCSLLCGRISGAVEKGGFQYGDAIEAPGGIGELLGELGFGRSGGLVFVEELAAMELEGGGVLGGENGGAAG